MNPCTMLTFQGDVRRWAEKTFGKTTTIDVAERGHRFVEEAIELAQSIGVSKEECASLLDYVYNRPVGEKSQEVGGVMVTLAALCSAIDVSLSVASEVELQRIWENIDKIRAKHKTKPRNSPLPGDYPALSDYHIGNGTLD